MGDKSWQEIRRMLAKIRDAEDYDHAYAAAEGYVNHVARLTEENARLREALGVADNAIQIAIGYVFPSQGVGGATMDHLRVASDTIAAALVKGEQG